MRFTAIKMLPRKQTGVILFLTLIALLAMSLAVVALIRSVDTSTIIAGNLAFKQSATLSGDAGVESAIKWIQQVESLSPVGQNHEHCLALNYRFGVITTACPDTNIFPLVKNPGYQFEIPNEPIDLAKAQWQPTKDIPDPSDPNLIYSKCASGDPDITGRCPEDANGNRIQYVIHRMCQKTDNAYHSALTGNCLSNKPSGNASNRTVTDYASACGANCQQAGPPQYRITTKAEGPRNTVSYVQAFVY